MRVIAFYCEQCNRRISQEEIEEGNIAKTEHGYICAECAQKLKLLLEKEKSKKKQSGVSPVAVSSQTVEQKNGDKRESKITTYNIREEVVDEYALYGLDKKVTRAIPQTPQKKKSPTPFILGGMGLLLLLILAIIALSSGNSSQKEYVTNPNEKSGISPEISTRGGSNEPPKTPIEDPWANRQDIDRPGVLDHPSQQTEEKEGPWKNEFEDAMAFKRRNPDDYAGVRDKLADILRKYGDKMDFSFRNKIETEQDKWEDEWRKKAEKAFEDARNKVKEAQTLEEKLRVWENFSKRFLDVGDTRKKIEEEKAILNSVKEAITKFPEYVKEAEEMLAKRDYLGAGTKIKEWLTEYVEPYEDETEENQKLLALLTKERDEANALLERINKEYEAYLSQARQNPEKQPTPGNEQQPSGDTPWKNWEAYKKLLEQNFARLDGDAQNPELSPGSSSTISRIARLGQGIEIKPVQGEGNEITNSGVADAGIYPAFKKVYLWEAYTMSLRIKVTNGEARIGIRMNYTQQGMRGNAYRMGSGDWVDLKVEVEKDKAEIYINGQKGNTILLDSDNNPPVGFPIIILNPGAKIMCGRWEINLKTMRK